MAQTANITVSPKHWSRFTRFKREGMALEEIAAQDNVKPDTIRSSIMTVEAYRSIYGLDQMNMAQMQTLIDVRELEKEAVISGLTATKLAMVDGKQKEVPDHDARNATIHELTEKVKAMQPKVGPRTSVNVGVGISSPAAQAAPGSTFSYEDRLREINRKRAKELLPAPLEEEGPLDALDAEVIDANTEARPAPE